MALVNVTETYQPEKLNSAPANAPVFKLVPPVNLADPEVYSRNNGYTHEAYDQMRSEAPIMWHPEAEDCLLYTSPSPRDATLSRMPSSA